MAQTAITEGRMPFAFAKQSFKTFYKIVGDLSGGKTPIIMLHGGPGSGHEYLLPLAALWTRFAIPVVFYDQVGCAASTHLPEKAGDESFWQADLFIAELDNLIDGLGLRSGFHIYGQSCGGMLGAVYAASRPAGLERLVLASALASQETAMKGLKLLREGLAPEHQKALVESDSTGKYDTNEYNAAFMAFSIKHFCRAPNFPPPELVPAMMHLKEDPTVYGTMYGPSPLCMTGSLRNWDVISQLPQITAPTLVFNGEYDTSHDVATKPFFEHIPRVHWATISDAGHMCHLEGVQEKVFLLVKDFLLGN